MSVSATVRCGLAVAAATIVVCGCSSGSPRLAPIGATGQYGIDTSARRASAIVRTVKPPDVFVSEFFGAEVFGYTKAGGSPIETLSGLGNPEGLAFDKKGNLYVADSSYGNVTVFAPGQTTPFLKIAVPSGSEPYRVAVDGRGHVWAASNATSGMANLSEFSSKGRLLQTIMCTDLRDYSGGLAVDRAGNAFLVGITKQRNVVVEELPAGQTACTVLPPKPYSMGGLAVTKTGDLVVGDNINYDAFTYAAPAFRRIIQKTNFGGGTDGRPIDIALTKDNAGIWIASYPGGGNGVSASLFPYPHGNSKASATIDIPHGALGIAVNY